MVLLGLIYRGQSNINLSKVVIVKKKHLLVKIFHIDPTEKRLFKIYFKVRSSKDCFDKEVGVNVILKSPLPIFH